MHAAIIETVATGSHSPSACRRGCPTAASVCATSHRGSSACAVSCSTATCCRIAGAIGSVGSGFVRHFVQVEINGVDKAVAIGVETEGVRLTITVSIDGVAVDDTVVVEVPGVGTRDVVAVDRDSKVIWDAIAAGVVQGAD